MRRWLPFQAAGGAPLTAARWHAVGPIAGFAIVEAADAVAIQKWVLDWSDLLSLEGT